MAVVNTKSTAITNADAGTGTLTNAAVIGAVLKEAVGTLEAVSGDSIGSVYRLARVPSNARMSRVLLCNDAITTCAADVGPYRTAADGGAVVDADFFGSAVSLASAVLSYTDVTHESGGSGNQFGEIANVEKPLWQALGLSADPGVLYGIALTLTAAAGSAGTVSLKAQYVQ